MAKIDVTRTELVWSGKYNDDGTRREVPPVNLPFQVIESINESRATREQRKVPRTLSLFEAYESEQGDAFEDGWRNKLIWGDNLLVMSSLLTTLSGKIDLIYIDPPFATGADFTFRAPVGEGEVIKQASIIEEKAYRDTWGRGIPSFLQMLFDRFQLMRDLLAESGLICVHMGWDVSHYVKVILDEVFGSNACVNQIIWKRQTAHSDIGQGSRHLGPIHDVIFVYAKSDAFTWNMQYQPYSDDYINSFYRYIEPETGRRYRLDNLTGPGGAAKGNPSYEVMGVTRFWRYSEARMRQLIQDGRVVQSKPGAVPSYKRYLDEMPGVPLQDLWLDINAVQPQAKERLGYDTQKPKALLQRIIRLGSNPNDLVADFFCGSGTTLEMAERLDRRWVGCDLGRFAIHTTRKRLLGIENCNPFEILNLGKYERHYWHVAQFGETQQTNGQIALYEYLAFILKLYGAQPVSGLSHLHGKKDRAMVHIGAVDAPVTIDEIVAALEECTALKQSELHVLGWEWEMGLYELMVEDAQHHGVKLLLLQIPREVMDQQAVDRGDVQFFELAYLQAMIEQNCSESATSIRITLQDFVIPNTELIPEDVRAKVTKWSDFIDYWAVDWDFCNDTFIQGWVAYRTRKERKLPLVSDAHVYETPGKHRVLVKVVDIFGNDTTQAFDVDTGSV